MSFLGAVLGGSNPTLSKDINAFGSIGGYAAGEGQNDLTAASKFMQSILSSPTAAMQTLAPQVNSIQRQGSQQLQTLARFGNRGGGTNAAAQNVSDQSRANINDMITKLISSSASGLGSLGQGLLSTGVNAYGKQADASQMQMQNWNNSILGQGIGAAAGFAEGKGLTKLASMFGGGSSGGGSN